MLQLRCMSLKLLQSHKFPIWYSSRLHDCTFKMRRNEARTGNVHQGEGLGAWQNVSFDKRMTKSSFASLTVPAWFVRQHGDKFQEFVVVKSEVKRGHWIVRVSVCFPHGRPQVAFHRGWKAFVVSNGLVKDDRMTFTLMAKSKFQVFIHRSNENSEARPRLQALGTSLMMKDGPQRRPKKSKRRPHHFVDVTEKREERRDEGNGLVAEACEAVEAKPPVVVAAAAAAAAVDDDDDDSSLSSSSSMASHFFEPLQALLPCFHS